MGFLRIIRPLLLLCCLCGCGNGFVYEEHLTGNYYLIGIDSKEDMDVCYYDKEVDVFLGIVGGGVCGAGFDEQFILVKKYKELENYRYDKSCLEYYIIPIDNTQYATDAQENCFGPFDEQGFEAKRRELGVANRIILEKK